MKSTNCSSLNRKWTDAQKNIMMETFLRHSIKELKKSNIHVSFDDLHKGDLKKLCDMTAYLLMANQNYMKLSAQKKIVGHQIQERLRSLVRQEQVQKVSYWGCAI
jgi:hypothetical protein